MHITGIDAIGARIPAPDAGRNDPTQEVALVRVSTDSGLVGLAECNHSLAPVLAVLEAEGAASIGVGVKPALLDRDPAERDALMRDAYERNIFSFRRGLGLAVLHAIDVCLWDLVAQARGEPLWRLLWGEAARPPRPYLTLYTGPGSYAESVSTLAGLIERGMPLGYTAAKLEPLEDCVPEDSIAAFVAEGRRLLGDEVELFVDFGHRFRDAHQAAYAIESIVDQRPSLIETPLLTDDVWEYGRLAELSPIPLAASELYESSWEFRVLLEIGHVAVVQPWPTRMGITETLVVAEHARRAGARCILAGWNTTALGIAAGLHVAAGLGTGVTVEHAPTQAYGFPLRALAVPEPVVRDGVMVLPSAPGLGVVLDGEAVERYRV